MDKIIQNAKKGNKNTIQYLHCNNFKKVYFMANKLLADSKKAEDITVSAFTEALKGIGIGDVQNEEQFSKKLLKITAENCRAEILKKNNRAFRLPENRTFPIVENENGNYFENFSIFQKFIFVINTVCDFSAEESAKTVKLDIKTYNAAIESQKKSIENGGNSYEEEKEKFILQINEIGELPEIENKVVNAVKTACVSQNEKFNSQIGFKIATAVAILVLVGLIAFTFIKILVKDKPETASTTESGSQEVVSTASVDASVITAPVLELNGSAQYFADIDVKDYGKITVKLDQNVAPITVSNFINLSNNGFYNGLTFHRIMEGFMMQGGDPEGTGNGGSKDNILGEFSANGVENNISHKRGVISMARANDYNSASSQFFIVHEDSTFLDGNYAAFGEVENGMDVVDAVCKAAKPTDDNGTIKTAEQPIINSIKIRTVE